MRLVAFRQLIRSSVKWGGAGINRSAEQLPFVAKDHLSRRSATAVVLIERQKIYFARSRSCL